MGCAGGAGGLERSHAPLLAKRFVDRCAALRNESCFRITGLLVLRQGRSTSPRIARCTGAQSGAGRRGTADESGQYHTLLLYSLLSGFGGIASFGTASTLQYTVGAGKQPCHGAVARNAFVGTGAAGHGDPARLFPLPCHDGLFTGLPAHSFGQAWRVFPFRSIFLPLSAAVQPLPRRSADFLRSASPTRVCSCFWRQASGSSIFGVGAGLQRAAGSRSCGTA